MKTLPCLKVGLAFLTLLILNAASFAQESEVGSSNANNEVITQAEINKQLEQMAQDGVATGNTAWMITATALVLFMTLPGLALFYGGLVQSKNVLSVLMHCFAIACLASIIWVTVGYSLALTPGGLGDDARGWIGGKSQFFLQNLTTDSLNGDFPESVWITFQMTFAIITPGLIVGAFVERIKFTAVLLFSALWLIVVYCPVCYWVWGGGWLSGKAIDFAGGIVVHATAGASALTLAWMLGRRQGYPKSLKPPHSPGMVMTGAAMLWVGWFGFNAGSAAAANGSAGMAMLVTHISAATASLVWMFIEWFRNGGPSLVEIVNGMVAGLATVTLASGFIAVRGGLILGIAGGAACYIAVDLIRVRLRVDDSLDVFAVHGVDGIVGNLLVVWLTLLALGGVGLFVGANASSQSLVQLWLVGITVLWTGIGSYAILKLIDLIISLRVDQHDDIEGLYLNQQGGRGYYTG